MTVIVVNVINNEGTNSAFVPVSQNLTEGIIEVDNKGYYAVALVQNLPGKSVARSADDSRVFDQDDLDE
jgi:hypothetical protein